MSCDFGVWFPHKRLSNKEAGALYARLCEGDTSEVVPHPAVDAFYTELTARHPEIETIPEERLDDHDYCPWSAALDRSPAHVIMPCVWSRADYVTRLVRELARKHGLAVYDPQSDRITYPDDAAASSRKPRWWRRWSTRSS
jgi:hypothetical protein